MKNLTLLAFLLPVTVTAQTVIDYQQAMVKFQRFYYAGQGDSITAMFQLDHQSLGIKPMWTHARTAKALKEFGTLKSFQYIGVDETDTDNVHVFQTHFSKAGTQTTSLTLYENNRVGTFRPYAISN